MAEITTLGETVFRIMFVDDEVEFDINEIRESKGLVEPHIAMPNCEIFQWLDHNARLKYQLFTRLSVTQIALRNKRIEDRFMPLFDEEPFIIVFYYVSDAVLFKLRFC